MSRSYINATLRSKTGSFWLFSTHLKTRVVDLTASHTLTQLYRNNSEEEAVECTYSFPLYESSGVSSFTATVNDRTLVGKVQEKAAARKIYDEAISQRKFAGLLEANSSDVFTTTIGNVPGHAIVRIDIEYIHDLKQDIGVDGIKLVIPTVIAPRYGSPPNGLSRQEVWHQYRSEKDVDSDQVSRGLALEIDVTMSGDIRQVQSSSHPLAVHIGTHGDASSNSSFDSKKAYAKLGTDAKSLDCLDADFTLTIVATDLDKPRGFLAPHPTDPKLSTMMLTLVPKFSLQQQLPEIVFIVDRSGSMGGKIKTLKEALRLFLASLPLGAHFNICSFGSHHSFLFDKSKPYTEESLAEAKAHIETFDANYRGTEMYEPIKATCARRLADLDLEILFLTDGDIWNKEPLIGLVSEQAEKNVRLFSLGIGSTVTHSTVEALARAGKGYAQTVGTSENIDKKVIRMLKAALTPHVDDWEVTWKGKSSLEEAFLKQLTLEKEEEEDSMILDSVPTLNETVNLYDESVDADNPPPAAPVDESLPELPRPPILQAPTEIPPLYPFSRFKVYFQLNTTNPPPKEVTLIGTFADKATDSITPLALTVPLTTLPAASNLHTMFGRVHLQDLSEAHYPNHFSVLIDPKAKPAQFEALVKREGVKAGLDFGLASKWTSFVAVDQNSSVEHPTLEGSNEDVPKKKKKMRMAGIVSGNNVRYSATRGSGLQSYSSNIPAQARYRYAGMSDVVFEADRRFISRPSRPSSEVAEERGQYLGGTASKLDEPLADEDMGFALFDSSPRSNDSLLESVLHSEPTSRAAPSPKNTAPTPKEIKATILSSQEFSGKFNLTVDLLKALRIEGKLKIDEAVAEKWVWATVLVYLYLDRSTEFKEELEMVREKARAAIKGSVEKVKVERVEKVVNEVLDGEKEVAFD